MSANNIPEIPIRIYVDGQAEYVKQKIESYIIPIIPQAKGIIITHLSNHECNFTFMVDEEIDCFDSMYKEFERIGLPIIGCEPGFVITEGEQLQITPIVKFYVQLNHPFAPE